MRTIVLSGIMATVGLVGLIYMICEMYIDDVEEVLLIGIQRGKGFTMGIVMVSYMWLVC